MMASVNFKAALACARENDVVVLFGIQGGTALLLTAAARILGRKLVSVNKTLHADDEQRRRWWIRRLKGWVLRRCRVHVVETPTTPKTLASVYGLDPATFVEAPFESGLRVFQQLAGEAAAGREALRAEFGWDDECVFLFVGTLLPLKGMFDILQAVRRLQENTSRFRVVFCGPASPQTGDPTIDDYRSHAQRLGVSSRVAFIGNLSLSELAKAYRAADAFVLPSYRETFGKVFVQAATFGLPLIASDACGAVGSFIHHGRSGLVVPPGDAEALARAMTSLLDKDLRKELGSEARAQCHAFCDPARQAEGFVEAIERAAGRNGFRPKPIRPRQIPRAQTIDA